MAQGLDHITRVHDEFAFARLRNSETIYLLQGIKNILQEIAQNSPDLQDVGILKDFKTTLQTVE